MTSVDLGSFDPNGFYILLSKMAEPGLFHWGFYLSINKARENNPLSDSLLLGTTYHVTKTPTNDPATNNKWRYEEKKRYGVATSKAVVVAIKVGVLDPALHGPLGEILAGIPLQNSTIFHEASSCRVWLKDALHSLDERGFIKLKSTVEAIEEEAFESTEVSQVDEEVQIFKSQFSDA